MPQQVTITPDESYVPAVNIVQISQEPKSFTQEINLGTENIDDQSILILNQAMQMQQIQEDIQAIKQDVKTILNNQNALFELQSKLLLKHSEFQIQFEEYIKLSSKSQVLNQDDAIKIIKNLNDLDNFEKNLSDAILKEEYRKKLHVLCNKGSGKGTSNAYYLIDHLFDREFLKGCSWTGSSKKDSDTEKICFKAFQKTIQFFFDIVHESDKTFTKADCEKFFKIVLKNARQRCESNKRASASRQRVKGKKNKIDIIATSSVSAIFAEQPVPADFALPAPDPSLEQNQRGVANMEVDVEVHQSLDSAAVQPSDSATDAVQPNYLLI